MGALLDYSQYCFILGMLGENLGEPLEEFERPSSVIQDPLGKVTGTFSFSFERLCFTQNIDSVFHCMIFLSNIIVHFVVLDTLT